MPGNAKPASLRTVLRPPLGTRMVSSKPQPLTSGSSEVFANTSDSPNVTTSQQPSAR